MSPTFTQDIIGGSVLPKPPLPGSRPYLASIGTGDVTAVGQRAGHNCGASLVAPNVALTAAHCFECVPTTDNPNCNGCAGVCGAFKPKDWIDFKRYDLTGGLNGVDRRMLSQTHDQGVNYVVRHPSFNSTKSPTCDFDFAVICLSDPVDGIVPVQLNNDGSIPVNGTELDVFGWGRTQKDPTVIPTNIPQMADVTYLSNSEVLGPPYNRPPQLVTASMMFTIDPTQSVCQGDSGMCEK